MTAPYFSLTRAESVACVLRWDADKGECGRIAEPMGFESYREHENRLRAHERHTPQANSPERSGERDHER